MSLFMVKQNRIVTDSKIIRLALMKNWSINVLFDMPKISSKTIIEFSYSLRGLISFPISLYFILESELCSGGNLLILYVASWANRERNFNTREVAPEKRRPTKSVRLILLTLSSFGCWFWIKVILLLFFVFSFCSNSFYKQFYLSSTYFHLFLCHMLYKIGSFKM